MEKIIEKRFTSEIRAVADNRTISGSAIVFDQESVLLGGWFTEVIRSSAVTSELIEASDIVMLLNHENDSVPLARSKNGSGSLAISIEPKSVDFSFDTRPTSYGDEILAAVRAGDLDSASFAFTVAEGGEEWFAKPDGTYLRTINKIEALYDFSIVTHPAYEATSVRSRDSVPELQKREEPEPAPVEPTEPAPVVEPAADPIPDTYYTELEAGIKENE